MGEEADGKSNASHPKKAAAPCYVYKRGSGYTAIYFYFNLDPASNRAHKVQDYDL